MSRPILLLVLTVCAIQLVDVLSTTIVIVALPAMQSDLNLTDGMRDQVAAVYALLFGALLLLAGRLSDRFGPRRLFMAGLVAFGLGSLIGGLAPGGEILIAGRAIQGIGAALSVPAALAMITAALPDGPDRTRVLGWWAAAGAAGGAAGFALGGMVTDALGWRWTMLANVPPVIVALIVIALIPPVSHEPASDRVPARQAVALTGGMLLLIFGLTEGQAVGLDLLRVLLPVVVGVALLGLFAHGERGRGPLVAAAAWRDRALVVGSLAGAALTFTTSAGAVLLTLWLQAQAGLSASAAGWALAPFSVAVVVGATVGSRLVTRLGATRPLAWGLATVALAHCLHAGALGLGSVPLVVGGMVVSGAGLGVATVASTALGLSRVDPETSGVASGLLNATARVGTALGIACYGILAAAGREWALDQAGDATVFGYVLAHLVGVVVLVAMIVGSRRGRSESRRLAG
jgi:MFS family permease